MLEGGIFVDITEHLQDDGSEERMASHGSDTPLDVFASGEEIQFGEDPDPFVLPSGEVVPMGEDELILGAEYFLERSIQG